MQQGNVQKAFKTTTVTPALLPRTQPGVLSLRKPKYSIISEAIEHCVIKFSYSNLVDDSQNLHLRKQMNHTGSRDSEMQRCQMLE